MSIRKREGTLLALFIVGAASAAAPLAVPARGQDGPERREAPPSDAPPPAPAPAPTDAPPGASPVDSSTGAASPSAVSSGGAAAVVSASVAPVTTLEQAKGLIALGKDHDAIRVLEGALAAEPDSTPAAALLASVLERTDETTTEVYLAEGNELRQGLVSQRRRTPEAQKLLEKLHQGERGGEAAIRLAIVEWRLGHDARAVELLSSVAPVGTLGALARYDLGIVQLRAGDGAAATTALRSSLALDPSRGGTRLALGLAQLVQGDDRAARQSLEDCERAAQDLAPLCAFYLGLASERLGELDRAVADYGRAATAASTGVGRSPLAARARTALGHALLEAGRPGEAVGPLGEAVAQGAPPRARFYLGLALALSGDLVRAKKEAAELEAQDASLGERLEAIVSAREAERAPAGGPPR